MTDKHITVFIRHEMNAVTVYFLVDILVKVLVTGSWYKYLVARTRSLLLEPGTWQLVPSGGTWYW